MQPQHSLPLSYRIELDSSVAQMMAVEETYVTDARKKATNMIKKLFLISKKLFLRTFSYFKIDSLYMHHQNN